MSTHKHKTNGHKSHKHNGRKTRKQKSEEVLRAQITAELTKELDTKYLTRIDYLIGCNNELMHALQEYELTPDKGQCDRWGDETAGQALALEPF